MEPSCPWDMSSLRFQRWCSMVEFDGGLLIMDSGYVSQLQHERDAGLTAVIN